MRRPLVHVPLFRLFVLSVGACIFLLIITFAIGVLGPLPGPEWQFNLALENNLAAWWSGMLLAIVALFAADGAALHGNRETGAARAWLLIAGVLLFLSLDEVGSLHERLALFGKGVGVGRWGLLLPLGAVLAVSLVWAILLLYRAGGAQRQCMWPIILGFCLLGSVAIQEFVEKTVEWNGDLTKAIRLVVEEGTELVGMLILLRTAMVNSDELMGSRVPRGATLFTAFNEYRKPLLVTTLLLALALVPLTMSLEDNRGHPADWLSATIFLAAAALPVRIILLDKANGAVWGLAALCIAASLACVALSEVGVLRIATSDISTKGAALAVLSLLICAVWAADHRYEKDFLIISPLVMTACLSLLIPATTATGYLLPILLGLIAFRGNDRASLQPSERAAGLAEERAIPEPPSNLR